MNRQVARGLLAALPAARDAWVRQIVNDLRAQAIWLAGSLGRGEGDEWSDVDLLVVGGDLPLDGAILTLDVRQNGPAGGRYVGAMYDIGPLPLWVDWYAWPADLPAPRDARLLTGHGSPGHRTLFESLDHHGRGSTTTPDRSTFALAMLPLTAKFIARGQSSAAARMAQMLGVDTCASPIDRLRDLLAITPAAQWFAPASTASSTWWPRSPHRTPWSKTLEDPVTGLRPRHRPRTTRFRSTALHQRQISVAALLAA